MVALLRAAGCVYAEDEAALLVAEAADAATLEGLVARRVAGEPLEHLLGWAEFAGRRMVVAPGVFVPRRRTELLAREAVRAARAAGPEPVVVELCCGVAAVAAVVADDVPGSVVLAVDDDPAAVACARANLGERGTAMLGDLDGPLPADLRGRVDVLVANPPHVPTDEIALMPPEARDHEARSALDGGPDGTLLLRRVVAAARTWLAPDGVLLVEAGRAQAIALAAEVEAGPGRSGWRSGVRTDDEIEGTVTWIGTKYPSSDP